MEQYPNNSQSYLKNHPTSAKQERPEVTPVITNGVKIHTKSKKERFLSIFCKEDLRSVRKWLWEEALIPGVKHTVLNTISMIFFGSPASPTNISPIKNTISNIANSAWVPYGNFFNAQQKPVYQSNSIATKYAYNELEFDDRGKAEILLQNMRAYLQQYGNVSIAEMNSFCQLPSNFTDRDFGWYDLSTATVVYGDNAWKIIFPTPVPLK